MNAWTGWHVDFGVDRDGLIVLPFVGEFQAADRSTGDLSIRIADALRETLLPSSLLGVTVEIVVRQPVYVHGVVRDAGEIAYRDDMTVREAIAVAGGVLRTDQVDGVDQLRSDLLTRSQIIQLRQREDELTARVERLTAEIDAEAKIGAPAFLDETRGSDLLERERQVYELNREKRSRALALTESRIVLLQTEIGTLKQKTKSFVDQQEVAAKQLNAVQELAGRGLSVNARLLDAQRTYSAIETQLLEVSSALLAARQDIARAEAERLEIVQGQTATAINQLQSALSDLDETRARRTAQERLLGLMGVMDQPIEALLVTVFRVGDAVPKEVDLNEMLEPGDIVEVTVPASP